MQPAALRERATPHAGDALDDDIGVAVEFEEEEEKRITISTKSSRRATWTMRMRGRRRRHRRGCGGEGRGGDDAGAEVDDDVVDASEIDAYWLQRQIAAAFGYTDAEASESEQDGGGGARSSRKRGGRRAPCENQLVLMLDYDKFDLIKKLLKSRARVVWCTRLARAQGDEERAVVEEQMRARPEAAKILDLMSRSGERASARARQSGDGGEDPRGGAPPTR